MSMQPTEYGKQNFNITRLHDTPIGMDHGEVVFEIELRMRHLDQRLFIGLLDAGQIDARNMSEHRGVGVSIDPDTGEVFDTTNGSGIVGYLDEMPLEVNLPTFLCLEFEKIKRIYIPKLTVGEEKILHPALHLPDIRSLSLVVGSTAGDGAVYENPHLMVTRRTPGVSA